MDDDLRFDAGLLERHRPVLRFDPQYDYRLLGVESALRNEGNILRRLDGEVIARAGGEPELTADLLVAYPGGLKPRPDDCLAMAPDCSGDARRMEWSESQRGRIYGRVKEDCGRTWLQYWFWLYYNPKHLMGLGKHEGDWEMVQIGLDADGAPEVLTYAQHDSGEARLWSGEGVEHHPQDGNRPIVYVAPLSHAAYFEPGAHPYLVGIDHPLADGPGAAELPVEPFAEWVYWPGRWGSSERKVLSRFGGGPASPSYQNPKWSRPGLWHREQRERGLRRWMVDTLRRGGRLTDPNTPGIVESTRVGRRVHLRWQLRGGPRRRGRHLYVTLHERHFVIASRIVDHAPPTGEVSLAIPDGRQPTATMISAYNRVRQRSAIGVEPVQ